MNNATVSVELSPRELFLAKIRGLQLLASMLPSSGIADMILQDSGMELDNVLWSLADAVQAARDAAGLP